MLPAHTGPQPLSALPTPWHLQSVQGSGIPNDLQDSLTFCFRQPGMRYHDGRHTRCLIKSLHLWGIPPWHRDHLHLIFYQHTLIAIGDVFIHPNVMTDSNERVLFLATTKSPP